MARIRKHKGAWQVLVRDGFGRDALERSVGTFRRKPDAERAARDAETDRDGGVFVDPALARVPLVDEMRARMARDPGAYNTRRNGAWALGKVEAYFGPSRTIGQIAPSEYQAFVTDLGRTLEPRSVATVWRFVRQTLRDAHLDGKIRRDPTSRVRLPRYTGGEVIVPTDEDVLELFESAPADFAVMVVLGAGLGLRASEATGLTVDRIDWTRREVAVDRQWHGKLDRFAPVKYDSSNRVIPASDEVLAQLALHLERHGAGAHDVLLHASGRPLNSNRMDWRWERTAPRSRQRSHSTRASPPLRQLAPVGWLLDRCRAEGARTLEAEHDARPVRSPHGERLRADPRCVGTDLGFWGGPGADPGPFRNSLTRDDAPYQGLQAEVRAR